MTSTRDPPPGTLAVPVRQAAFSHGTSCSQPAGRRARLRFLVRRPALCRAAPAAPHFPTGGETPGGGSPEGPRRSSKLWRRAARPARNIPRTPTPARHARAAQPHCVRLCYCTACCCEEALLASLSPTPPTGVLGPETDTPPPPMPTTHLCGAHESRTRRRALLRKLCATRVRSAFSSECCQPFVWQARVAQQPHATCRGVVAARLHPFRMLSCNILRCRVLFFLFGSRVAAGSRHPAEQPPQLLPAQARQLHLQHLAGAVSQALEVQHHRRRLPGGRLSS